MYASQEEWVGLICMGLLGVLASCCIMSAGCRLLVMWNERRMVVAWYGKGPWITKWGSDPNVWHSRFCYRPKVKF